MRLWKTLNYEYVQKIAEYFKRIANNQAGLFTIRLIQELSFVQNKPRNMTGHHITKKESLPTIDRVIIRVGFKCIKNPHHMDLWALDSISMTVGTYYKFLSRR